jgi:hypothetical protein
MAQLNSTNILGNLAISGNTLSSKFIKLGGADTQVLLANGDVKEISGTWPISISGNAATASSASSVAWGNVNGKPSVFPPDSHTHTSIVPVDTYSFNSSTLPTSFALGVSTGFVDDNSGFGSYGTVLTSRSYSSGGGTLQIYAPYSAGYGGTHMKARFGDYGKDNGNSWTALKEIAWVSDIPTKNSQLTNDSGYITSSGSCSSATTAGTATTLSGLTASITELNYVDGVTSAIQTQLNAKVNSSDCSSAGNRASGKIVTAAAAGQINSDKYLVTSSGTGKVTLQYNTTYKALEFSF